MASQPGMTGGGRGVSAGGPALRRPLLALLPITALDLVLFVFPMLIMAAVSFLQAREFELTRELTLRNYTFFLGNWIYLKVLLRTILVAAVVTAICLVLAYPFAYFLLALPRRWQRTFLILVVMPFWTSYLLRVYAWMTILGERGVVNQSLMLLGVLQEPARFLLHSYFAVVVVSVYLYLPYSVLALYTTLERLDRSLVRAAQDLGASPVQAFRPRRAATLLAWRPRLLRVRLHPDAGRVRDAATGGRGGGDPDRQHRGLSAPGAPLRDRRRHDLRHRGSGTRAPARRPEDHEP